MDELDGALTPVSVRLDAEPLATLDALAAEWQVSRSGVFRRLLLSAPRAVAAAEAGSVPALGRVPLEGVTIRPESVAWMDARALAWGWDRAQVVRLLLSEGRKVVELKRARAASGRPVAGWGPRRDGAGPVVEDRVDEPVDVDGAPVPA